MKAKRPYATRTKRRTYTVTDDVHGQLADLGEEATGKRNASAGIREAVRLAMLYTKPQIQ